MLPNKHQKTSLWVSHIFRNEFHWTTGGGLSRTVQLLAARLLNWQSSIMNPRRQYFPAAKAILIGLVVLNTSVELILLAADHGVIGTPRLRAFAYQNGAFWAGLLHDWQPNYAAQPWLMFLSYAFLHGGPGHLAGNMVMLWFLGHAVVARTGQFHFLGLYALSAIGGGLVFGIMTNNAQPMVGASGAIFGLAGAILYWHWSTLVQTGRSPWPIWRTLFWLALLNLLIWIALGGLLAWQTHLGGFVAGWIAAAALERLRRG